MDPKTWKQKALEFVDKIESLTENETQKQKEKVLTVAKELAYEGWGQVDSKIYDAYYLIYADIVCAYIYFEKLLPNIFYKFDLPKKKRLISEFRKYCIAKEGEN